MNDSWHIDTNPIYFSDFYNIKGFIWRLIFTSEDSNGEEIGCLLLITYPLIS